MQDLSVVRQAVATINTSHRLCIGPSPASGIRPTAPLAKHDFEMLKRVRKVGEM